jgi:hypothetical protein
MLYTCVLWKFLENIFLLFFLSFSDFLCEASGWCVSECSNDAPGCPDDTVDLSRRPFFLSKRACFCNLLHSILSGRHLSSVQTVNPVGLNRILPGVARHFLLSFGSFCCLVHFFYTFTRTSQAHVSSLQFISTPGMFLYSFTNLL